MGRKAVSKNLHLEASCVPEMAAFLLTRTDSCNNSAITFHSASRVLFSSPPSPKNTTVFRAGEVNWTHMFQLSLATTRSSGSESVEHINEYRINCKEEGGGAERRNYFTTAKSGGEKIISHAR